MSSSVLAPPRAPIPHPLLGTLSDERLAKLAAQGSDPAFAAIYKRYHQPIYRYCHSITGNEQDARDALQESMIKALQSLNGESREIALKPWLFRIAHNEAVSLLRRRRTSAPIDAIGEMPAADDSEARERVRELFDDLSHLTPRQRGALVMRELTGLSFAEIGAAMDTSEAGAKQTVYDARQALLEVSRGRGTDCGDVRERISAGDRRLLRGRGMRAHLASCSACRDFEAGIGERTKGLAMVSPLPATAAAGILNQILGGGAGAGGAGAALVGGGASLTALAKLGIAGVVALGIGTVAIEANDTGPSGHPGVATAPATVVPRAEHSALGRAGGDAKRSDAARAHGSARHGSGGAASAHGHGHGGGSGSSSVSSGTGPGSSGAGESSTAGGTAQPAGTATASAGGNSTSAGLAPGAGQGPPTGSATGPAGSGGSPPAGSPPAASPPAASPPGGSSGGGPASTPPGHGGIPPGQGGVPPGLGVPAPGQGGTPPGLDGNLPPGQGGPTPGHSGG